MLFLTVKHSYDFMIEYKQASSSIPTTLLMPLLIRNPKFTFHYGISFTEQFLTAANNFLQTIRRFQSTHK